MLDEICGVLPEIRPASLSRRRTLYICFYSNFKFFSSFAEPQELVFINYTLDGLQAQVYSNFLQILAGHISKFCF